MRIGKRQHVNNLRDIWQRETDFSDWLTTEDGLQLIAEDIGIEVENLKREHRLGDFPCDIVGHLVGDEKHIVIIENQFGKSDHDHLGKLLTYASVNNATTAIWLTEQVSDDHRKVIDWLNDNTPPHVSFYLAQVKAYRIDDSPVAPQLDVVSRPNLEVKVRREHSSAQDKAIESWRRDLWQEILAFIKAQNPPFKVQSPSSAHWSSISLGRSSFNLALLLLPGKRKIGCEFIASPSWKSAAFKQLQSERSEIERIIGHSLEWQDSPHLKRARIFLEVDIDPRDDNNRDKVKEWMNTQARTFYQAFRPRVQALQTPITPFPTESTNEVSMEDEQEIQP